MRGCDVANQLVGQYRLGLTDGGIDLTFGYYILTIMNMWKMHKEICLEKTWIPYNHLHLCLRLVRELMACGPVGKFVFCLYSTCAIDPHEYEDLPCDEAMCGVQDQVHNEMCKVWGQIYAFGRLFQENQLHEYDGSTYFESPRINKNSGKFPKL